MRRFATKFATAAMALAVSAAAFGYGYDGSLDSIHSALAEGVAGGNPSAVKMNNFVEKESTTLSKDFGTFAKVVKEAAKDDFSVLSEEYLAGQFSNLVEQSAFYGLDAFSHFAAAAGSNPLKAAKILKANAKYLVKQGKILAKYNEVWGDPVDESDVSLSKAAIYYSQVQKLYEIIEKAASKYDVE